MVRRVAVSNDKVVVIGYSYARGDTKIGIFDLDSAGQLRYRSTYHLRSNDYYSSRNYSSRLIGSRLIFYSPSYISRFDNPPLPALRKWHRGATESEFRRIAAATRIYRPAQPLESNVVVHTVTSCDSRASSSTATRRRFSGRRDGCFMSPRPTSTCGRRIRFAVPPTTCRVRCFTRCRSTGQHLARCRCLDRRPINFCSESLTST